MTPTTKAGRALLENLRVWTTVSPHWEGPEDEVWGYVVLDLTRVEQEARADEAEALRAALDRMRVSLDRALLQWSMHSDEARMADPDAHGTYPIHEANDIEAQLYREGVAVSRAVLATPAAPVACGAVSGNHVCTRVRHGDDTGHIFEKPLPAAPVAASKPVCRVCGVDRWVSAHDPEAGPSHHPFQPAPAAPAEPTR